MKGSTEKKGLYWRFFPLTVSEIGSSVTRTLLKNLSAFFSCHFFLWLIIDSAGFFHFGNGRQPWPLGCGHWAAAGAVGFLLNCDENSECLT